MVLRIVLLSLGFLLWSGSDWDRRPRKREGCHPNLRAVALVDATTWEREPEAPKAVDHARFSAALVKLCARAPKERVEAYAGWVLQSAAAHGEDPFLLAAVMHRMSSCKADAKVDKGFGLTGIQPAMIKDNVRGRTLRYVVPTVAGWKEREKELSRPLTEATLKDPQTNLEWAAALLAMWREQHAFVDRDFEQNPHRHYVSHFVWGDRIVSDREEDRIFTDRRRLLGYYGLPTPELTQVFRGMVWGSPLEASPRVVSSAPGAYRTPKRRHRGVDVEGVVGEPVLAMADGVVFFAGVDLPGQGARAAEPHNIKRVPRGRMGPGGRFVCIDHNAARGPEEAFLRSCYMHLEDVHVKAGDVVRRGDPIGTVGLTGVKHSPPHLHLEIKSDKRFYDARDVLPKILIGEPPPEPKRRKTVPRA